MQTMRKSRPSLGLLSAAPQEAACFGGIQVGLDTNKL